MRHEIHETEVQLAARRAAEEIYDRGLVDLAEAEILFKRAFLWTALCKHGGHVSEAAAELGIHRNTMTRLMHELQLHWRRGRQTRKAA